MLAGTYRRRPDEKLVVKLIGTAVKENNLVLGKSDPRPKAPLVVVRPNRYESGRANIAVHNFAKQPAVAIDVGKVLQKGDRYALHDPCALFGKVVVSGTYEGTPLQVLIGRDLAAFVLRGAR